MSNACGLLDISCYIAATLAPVFFWLKVGLIGFAVIVTLLALWWVYRRFGWYGVVIAVTAGVAGFLGYKTGRFLSPSPRYVPPAPKPKPIRKVPVQSDAPGTWNYSKGMWNE